MTMGNAIQHAMIGASASFSKTISESDIYMFAGISGDFHPFHVDEEYARKNGSKGRIAHGLLTLSLFSTVGTLVNGRYPVPTVAYGYERIRFLKPVYIGDTITATYLVTEKDEPKSVTYADCTCTNQDGETVLVAKHITKFLDV